MVGLGTLINVACIVAGGLVGLLCRGAITQRLQQALLRSCGAAVMFVGVNLIWPRTFKPANMLPSVVIAVVYALIAQAVA